MKYDPEDELFSAYLDGELTAEEQAHVEQLLATSPAARQLLEELRNLSHTLQSLPCESLWEDLSPRVLREAERRMLQEVPQPLTPPGYRSRSGRDWAGLLRGLFRPRVIFGSAIAVGLALMLILQGTGRREVAQAPAPPRSLVPAAGASHAAVPPRSASPQVAHSQPVPPTDRQPAAGKIASAPPRRPDSPTEDMKKSMELAASAPAVPPNPASPSPPPATVEIPKPAATSPTQGSQLAGPAAPPKAMPEASKAPAETLQPTVVRCDVGASAVQQGLFEKLMADQQVVQSSVSVLASESGKTIRIRAELSDLQLISLVAQMKARREAFSAIAVALAVPPAQKAAPTSSPVVSSTAPAPSQGMAASLQVEMPAAGRNSKPAAPSRVLFDAKAPPSSPAPTPSKPAASPATGDTRPVLFVLHVVEPAKP